MFHNRLMEYEFVRTKNKFNFSSFKKKLFKYLFNNPTRFVSNMVFYHVVIMISTIIFGIAVPAKVMLQLGLGDVDAVRNEMDTIQNWESTFVNILFLMIILFLDFALLLIIKSEVKSLNMTYFHILILEILIFIIGIFNPYVRTGLFFFSANTLQIAIAYRWFIKKWIVFQYFFIAGSYILILKLLFYIFWNYIL